MINIKDMLQNTVIEFIISGNVRFLTLKLSEGLLINFDRKHLFSLFFM